MTDSKSEGKYKTNIPNVDIPDIDSLYKNENSYNI